MNKKIIAAAIAGLALTGALAFGTTVSAADERPMVPPEYSQKGDAWTKNNDQYSSQQIQNMKKAEQKDQKEHAKKVKKHVKKDQKQDNFEQDRNKRYEDQGIHYGQKHEKKAPKVKKERTRRKLGVQTMRNGTASNPGYPKVTACHYLI